MLRSSASGTMHRASRDVRTTLQNHFDVVIAGGGIVGSSVAFHLAEVLGPASKICVVEKDPTYVKCSTTLSAGGIRMQFSLRENVQCSIYGAQFLREVGERLAVKDEAGVVQEVPDPQLRRGGYLILATEEDSARRLRQNHAMQKGLGINCVSLLDQNGLKQRFPWMVCDDVVLGSAGHEGGDEGWFDPWSLLTALKAKARSMGVKFVQAEVVGVDLDQAKHRVEGVRVRSTTGLECGGSPHVAQLASEEVLTTNCLVNAAGAQCASVVRMCGSSVHPIPVMPRKRHIFVIESGLAKTGQVPTDIPLVMNPKRVYFRPEGTPGCGTFICGYSPDECEDRDSDDPRDLETIHHDLFEEVIWPHLYDRAPELFEAVKVKGAWAGFYDYNKLDQNAIVGSHPDVEGLMLACGFSGHGLQQAPAVGRAIAELLVHGEFRTIDLSCFSFDRILKEEPLYERCIY